MKNIFWAGYSNDERNSALNEIKSAVIKYGDIVDFKLFSDVALTMTIELEECEIDDLYDELRAIIRVDKYEYMNSSSRRERTVFLNITFTNGTGNLKIETPAVPG